MCLYLLPFYLQHLQPICAGYFVYVGDAFHADASHLPVAGPRSSSSAKAGRVERTARRAIFVGVNILSTSAVHLFVGYVDLFAVDARSWWSAGSRCYVRRCTTSCGVGRLLVLWRRFSSRYRTLMGFYEFRARDVCLIDLSAMSISGNFCDGTASTCGSVLLRGSIF